MALTVLVSIRNLTASRVPLSRLKYSLAPWEDFHGEFPLADFSGIESGGIGADDELNQLQHAKVLLWSMASPCPPTPVTTSFTFDAYCYSTDQVGHAVYVFGNKVDTHFQVTRVDITHSVKHRVVGIIIAKLDYATCTVQWSGVASGIFSGLTPGAPVFVGTNGYLSHTPPPQPTSGILYTYQAGIALATDTVLIKLGWPTKLLSN